nr:hypothetical protein [Tanacetum cinerariifolium]
MWNSIDNGPYIWKEIVDPKYDTKKILKPIKDTSSEDQKQYYADIKVSQFEPHVKASKENKVAKNYDPLSLVANPHANPPYSYASPPYSHSPQPYYVTHPSSVIDYDDDYQGEIQVDAQEDKLSIAMMLLARAITQHYSTLMNNRLCMSSKTMNQAMIQDGRVDIQSKNVGYARNGNKNAGRTNMNQSDAEPTYDAEVISEVNASQIDMLNGLLSKSDHEHGFHVKLKTVILTSVDDQIDYDIIFNDPYVDNNSGKTKHDPNAHDQPYAYIESLIYNVQVEAENQRKMNNGLKK